MSVWVVWGFFTVTCGRKNPAAPVYQFPLKMKPGKTGITSQEIGALDFFKYLSLRISHSERDCFHTDKMLEWDDT